MTPSDTHQPRRRWYVVALKRELGRKPKAVQLLDLRLVVYRDRGGQARAHVDRCPHRNVPLSGGRCLKDDTLECPYHGWRFSPSGMCIEIPSLVGDPKVTHRVATYATREDEHFVWVCPDDEGREGLTQPLVVTEADSVEYSTLTRAVVFDAGMHAVIENALDVPHTSILHRGLFRTGERHRVQVVMRRYRERAEAEFIGEPPPQGIVARLLGLGGGQSSVVQHWDRFFVPGVLQVEYRLGTKTHFLITGFCSPEGSQRTRLFALACIKTPFWSWVNRVLLWMIEPIAMRLFHQDAEILARQAETIEHFGGERFMSTEVDVLGAAVTRLLKEARHREIAESDLTLDGPCPADPEEVPREVVRLELDA